MMTKSGETREVESHMVPLRDSRGNVQMLLSVIRDVSEQRELERMLRQSQKMDAVGRLAGGVAHDFNNILTGIMSLVEVGLISATGELADDLKELQQLCVRGADLTRQLLSFSRPAPAKNVVVNVNDVIREARNLIGRLIGEHIEIETALDPALQPVNSDPGLIQQVIVNMAVNARDAMPDGGRLTIMTRQSNTQRQPLRRIVGADGRDFVSIIVHDTGLGMSAEVLEHVFEPFFTTKPESRGTGLGMSTAYGIVKHLGGDISATSRPGQGSTFEILLPTLTAQETTEREERDAEPAGAATGAGTILVAEDDEAVRRLTARVLRSRGYKVLEAQDGMEALHVGDQHADQINLLVTDVVMPRLGGRELAEKLRERIPGIKILYVSGYTTDDAFRRLGNAHDEAFIQKPFAPLVLAGKVKELLSG
jgi:signal transduction histidine kinase